jgi:hypothetical protein
VVLVSRRKDRWQCGDVTNLCADFPAGAPQARSSCFE